MRLSDMGYRLRPGWSARAIQGEVLFARDDNDAVVVLASEAGVALWQVVEGGGSLGAALDALDRRFESASEALVFAVRGALEQLVAAGVLESSEGREVTFVQAVAAARPPLPAIEITEFRLRDLLPSDLVLQGRSISAGSSQSQSFVDVRCIGNCSFGCVLR